MKYRPKDFEIRELVGPDIFQALGDRSWELLDARALMTLQTLRDELGPILINTWHVGGTFQESGLRSATTTTGAKFSQHRYGRAFDCKFKNVTPQEAYEYILANEKVFPYLTTLENINATPSWMHFDCRNHSRPGIWIVNP